MKKDYWKIVNEEDFVQMAEIWFQLDGEIRKIAISLKSFINKIHCDYSNRIIDSFTHDSNSMTHDQPKNALSKLPQPVFSGKFEVSNLFKSTFNTLINDNPDLSENEKLFYLCGALIGELKIKETSDDNYIFKALE